MTTIMACNKNNIEVLNLDFSEFNDEFNWINSDVTSPIQTVGGQLLLNPSSATNSFRRGLGVLDPANNRIRLQANLDVFRSQISTAGSVCVVFGLYSGANLIEEFKMSVPDISPGELIHLNFDREYLYQGLSGNFSLRIDVPEGWQNQFLFDYLRINNFNFCEDNVRSYFVIDNLFENALSSQSSAIRLNEWKIDDVETLTPEFFSENNTPGGNPISDWKFAKANIDGSNRLEDSSSPNTFNPFVTEWGLTFDTEDSFHGGKAIETASGSDYGQGILSIGFEKPKILNGNLEDLFGAFFIDIDYSKNLKISFDLIINNSSDNVFDSPNTFRTYTILWDAKECQQRFFYTNSGSSRIINVSEDGFLFGLTNHISSQTVVLCDQSFSFEGESGVFEFDIDFGTATGQAGINYEAFSIPEKFEIIWDGNVVSSGFVGGTNNDQDLLNLGVPQNEINTGIPSTGSGTLLFNKTNPQPTTATIRVTAPLPSTLWNISGICPTGQPMIETPFVQLTAQSSYQINTIAEINSVVTDDDGNIVTWSIDYGDGSVENGTGTPPNIFSHNYTSIGVFVVRLTVVDNDTLISFDEVQFTINS